MTRPPEPCSFAAAFGAVRRLLARPTVLVPLVDPSAPKKFILAIDPAAPPPGLDGAVAAIGNFDGVHRGHVAVIERARGACRKSLAAPAWSLTFEPHPTDFFQGPNTIFRLTPRDAKAKRLERLGIDGMIVVTFDQALGGTPGRGFRHGNPAPPSRDPRGRRGL